MPTFTVIETKITNLLYAIHFTRDNQPFTLTIDRTDNIDIDRTVGKDRYRVCIKEFTERENKEVNNTYSFFDTYEEVTEFIKTQIDAGMLPTVCECDLPSIKNFITRDEAHKDFLKKFEEYEAKFGRIITMDIIKSSANEAEFVRSVRKYIDDLINTPQQLLELGSPHSLKIEREDTGYSMLSALQELADLETEIPIDIIRPLIQEVKRIQPDENVNCHPLANAAKRGHLNLVIELLAAGFRPDITDYHLKGTPALVLAIQAGHKEVAERLLQADSRLVDNIPYYEDGKILLEQLIAWDLIRGTPALVLAIQAGHKEVAKRLLEANPRLADNIDHADRKYLLERLTAWNLIGPGKNSDSLPQGVAQLAISSNSPIYQRPVATKSDVEKEDAPESKKAYYNC